MIVIRVSHSQFISSMTVLRGSELPIESPSESDRADHFSNFFRARSGSLRSMSVEKQFGRSVSHNSIGSCSDYYMDDSEVFDVSFIYY